MRARLRQQQRGDQPLVVVSHVRALERRLVLADLVFLAGPQRADRRALVLGLDRPGLRAAGPQGPRRAGQRRRAPAPLAQHSGRLAVLALDAAQLPGALELAE